MKKLSFAAALLAASAVSHLPVSAQPVPVSAQPAAFATAAQTDPAKLGWMQGAPPAPEKIIRADGTHYSFPKSRWSFSNWRALFPTTGLTPSGTPALLPRKLRTDIDALGFTPMGGAGSIRWDQSLGLNYTDAIIVLHKGRVVYERSFGVTRTDTPHISWSVTKSFVGLLAETLVAEGRLDPEAQVTAIIPELAQTGFAGATVRQVMDMTTGIAFDENYGDPNSDISRHALAGGMFTRPPGYKGPDGFLAFLATIGPKGRHGEVFTYRTANTDLLGWIVARAGGEPLAQQMQNRFWGPMGMAHPAYLHVDPVGTPFAGGGLSASVEDLARFGEMVRLNGRFNGRQIVPAAAVASIRAGADPAKFPAKTYPTLPGWSYRSQWWVAPDGSFSARGVHGQAIWIDPGTEVVIARVASHPLAGNVNFDPTSLPAYRAVAARLAGSRRTGGH